MEPSRFDDLTKTLATSTSRRQALKTLAATTLGSILGLAGIGTALASSPACARFCESVFGNGTPAYHQCINDSAQHKGLCYSCGPASSGGGVPPSSLCCQRTSRGFCSSYSGTHCPCDSSQCLTCQNGTCVSSCDACSTCQNGTCVSSCQGYCCPAGYLTACCTPDTFGCCSSDADCPVEFGCISGCCLAP